MAYRLYLLGLFHCLLFSPKRHFGQRKKNITTFILNIFCSTDTKRVQRKEGKYSERRHIYCNFLKPTIDVICFDICTDEQKNWIILLLASCIMTIDRTVMPLNISIKNNGTLQMWAFWALQLLNRFSQDHYNQKNSYLCSNLYFTGRSGMKTLIRSETMWKGGARVVMGCKVDSSCIITLGRLKQLKQSALSEIYQLDERYQMSHCPI